MTDEQAIQDFIARYAKPFDPEANAYDRPAFAEDIKEGKNDAAYSVHPYHTKVPPRGIIPFILHYTDPGDLVLDPFCGSGMTGVATQMCVDPPSDLLEQFPELKDRIGLRYAILSDLSPAACHITRNYTTPIDATQLSREFDRVEASVREEFQWLYRTEHYEPGVGLYDPSLPVVAERTGDPRFLGQPVIPATTGTDWEVIDQVEVERRLGYSVSKLPRRREWGDVDVSRVTKWICIPATIQYVVWSDVYVCAGLVSIEENSVGRRGPDGRAKVRKRRVQRGCGQELVLWDVTFGQGRDRIDESFCCPHCGQPWKKVQLQRSGCGG